MESIHIELPKEYDFNTKFDSYIIAFCPDICSWFVTNERFFYYQYGKELKQKNLELNFLNRTQRYFIIKN